jgi:hypothetical protein
MSSSFIPQFQFFYFYKNHVHLDKNLQGNLNKNWGGKLMPFCSLVDW